MKTWKYKVTIYTNEGTIIVQNPIGCKGTISRGVLSDSNKADIELYNLALSTREQIYQDPYQDVKNSKLMRVEVGYSEDDSIQQVFYGRILQAYSMHSGGSTEVITKISALCLDLFNTSSITFEAGTSKRDAIKALATDLPNVTLANLGNVNGVFQTPTTFDGNTLEQIQKIAGGMATIDNEQMSVCLLNEVIDVPIPVISNDTVLLETPVRKGMQLELNFIMQPYLQVNQLLEIDSKVYLNFNGQYKLIEFTHNFLISESVAGQKTTKATVLIGDALPSSSYVISDDTSYSGFQKVKKEQITPVKGKRSQNIHEVSQYIRRNNGAIPNTKITKSISWADVLGHNNKPNERVSELNIPKLANCYTIATNLQRIVDKYYPGKNITVNSCWRSIRNNSSCGGKSNSKHLSGLAIDFTIQGVSVKETQALFKQVWSGGIGWVGIYPAFTHIQIDRTNKLINDV